MCMRRAGLSAPALGQHGLEMPCFIERMADARSAQIALQVGGLKEQVQHLM